MKYMLVLLLPTLSTRDSLADEAVHEGELGEFRHICRLLDLEPDRVWQELIA